MGEMAVQLLRGATPENGMDLKQPGWENMQFQEEGSKTMVGAGWVAVDASNVGDFDF